MLLLSVFTSVIVLDACGYLVQPLVYLWLRQWRLLPRGTKISRNISFKSIFRLFREIYSSERKIVTLVSAEGVKVAVDKVDTVSSWLTPTCVQEV